MKITGTALSQISDARFMLLIDIGDTIEME